MSLCRQTLYTDFQSLDCALIQSFSWPLASSTKACRQCDLHAQLLAAVGTVSLCGTTHICLQGGGFSWLFPFQNGAPPIGWHDAICYLVLPSALVASQFITQKILQPPQQDEAAQSTNAILKFLPFMIGESQPSSMQRLSHVCDGSEQDAHQPILCCLKQQLCRHCQYHNYLSHYPALWMNTAHAFGQPSAYVNPVQINSVI